MERRNLELGPITAEQWDILGRTARDLTAVSGFDWQPDACNELGIFMTIENAPAEWRDWVSERDEYGASERRAATVLWNDGDPFARVEIEPLPESPNVLPQNVELMQQKFEHWLRGRWQELLRESGLHYTKAGHVTQV